MVDNIYRIARTSREKLAQQNSRSPVVRISQDNRLNEILELAPSKENDAFEYWMVIFLIHLEDNEPPRENIDHKTLTEKLSCCIGMIKSLFKQKEAISTLCVSIDGILCSEIQECTDIDHFIDWIEAGQSLLNLSSDFNFDYKKSAYLFLTKNIISDINDFSNNINVEKIPKTLNYLYRAFTCGIVGKELSYFIVDPVIEYIEENYLKKQVPPQEFHHTFKFIKQLHELVADIDQVQEIKEIYEKCSKIQDPNFVNFEQPAQPTPSRSFVIGHENVSRNPMPINTPHKISKNFQISIFEGRLKDSNISVIIKQYEFLNGRIEENKMINNEKEIYEVLSSQADEETNCFLKYYGTYSKDNSIFMVMENVSFYLVGFINQNKDKPSDQAAVKEDLFLKFAQKLANSYNMMINLGICHFDIKPDNLLLDSKLNLKIIDFNTSLRQGGNIELSKICQVSCRQGTRVYMCPQRAAAYDQGLETVSIIPQKSDVYSLGLVFYQLLTSKDVATEREMIENINALRDISKETKQFIRDMLSDNPSKRPNFSELLGKINLTLTTNLRSRLSSIVRGN
jgi:hypothetical protein